MPPFGVIMSLCLTMHVNLQLSLRKTAQALKDLYGSKFQSSSPSVRRSEHCFCALSRYIIV
ncbi:MAG TPA: hypothetical protein DCW90_17060 [Lachnospiraceae bacterium]|nr:hypothetical protein [Lachnospiraceae bacterium]